MHRHIRGRLLAGVGTVLCVTAVAAVPAGAVNQTKVSNAVTRTFSFIASPGGKAGKAILDIDGLLMNARCNTQGAPVVFAFSRASNADLFGRVFDGVGRVHVIHDTRFNSKSKGDLISPSSNDFDSSGSLLFENTKGQVVTVSIAMDNSTTLGGQRVCTVFGSWVAT